MKLLLATVVLYSMTLILAYPSENKSERQTTTQLNQKEDGINGQKKNNQINVIESAEEKQDEKSQGLTKPNSQKNIEKLKGAESIYHSLPMPFIHYPFPFVNSYTTRYFPYGYAGVGLDNGLGYGNLGYGGLGYGGSGHSGLGYAYGYGGWF